MEKMSRYAQIYIGWTVVMLQGLLKKKIDVYHKEFYKLVYNWSLYTRLIKFRPV